MIAKLQFTFRKSAWLLALLIITSALPARAQSEYYDEFYEDDLERQEMTFKFEFSDDLNGYIISPNKYGGPDWDRENMLFVPSIYLRNGLPVVGLSGFGSLKNLDLIFFPEDCHVKYICDYCFQYCTSLGLSEEPLNLPETVETIGNYAFNECTRLQVVKFGSNLKSIGISAFEKCSSLTSITLPKSLKVLREYAFRNCANYDNWGKFIGGGLESVKFEDGVDFYNTYGNYCFYNYVFWGCANLSSVTLPNGTPGRFIIPPGTFGYCGNLKSITFPTNTGKIEGMAFYRTGLESLDFTTIESALLYLSGYYTFAACENLKTITAKGKVRFDGLYTFQECTALETATFTGSDDDYTVMNPDAFKRCSNLKSVEFYHLKGNGQDNDMDSVFTDCTSLERVTSTLTPEISKIGYSCFDGCTSLKTLSLPDKAFAVNETAFRNCAALESFDFTNVTSIGKASFSGCTALASTPNISKLTTITEKAFEGCTSLTSLDFTNLSSIGPNAFNGCTALASVNFNYSSETPTTITASIGTQAFTGCTALASLNFNSSSYNPPTVESEDAFDASHYANTVVDVPEIRFRDFFNNAIWKKFAKLKHPMYAYTSVDGGYSIRKSEYALVEDFTGIVEIPATYNSQDVVAIEEHAFKDLLLLSSVTLHEKIASIGANAFAGCPTISTVINKRTEPLAEDVCPYSAFDSETYKGTLIVPFGSLDAYSNTEPWCNFSVKKQVSGDLILPAPTASHASCEFNQPFYLELTDRNGEATGATIYYYIVNDGDAANAVRDVQSYSTPFKISSSCTVVAYVSNGTQCSEPVSWTFTRQYVNTENGLDKVLAGNVDEEYRINTPLYGHYFDGTYLYASTIANNGSSMTSPTEEQKANASSDKEADFNQEDWVAILGLTSDYVGRTIDEGSVATVGSDPAYPVITFNENVSYAYINIGDINTYRVENFNSASSEIWLVAPQPAEYCTVRGYLTAANIHEAEGYLVLKSAESATTTENETVIEPLTMNVYYDPATITLGNDGWYSFTGIVKKEGDALTFTVLEIEKEKVTTNAELLSMEAGRSYVVNVNLQGVKAVGGVLYARTVEVTAALSGPREDHTGFDSYEDGKKLGEYDQRDWVAIGGLASEYEGKLIEPGFVALYDGTKLVPETAPAYGTDVDVALNTFGVANVFYGNYENTAGLGMTGGYQPFFVKAKVNEVANFLGLVKLNDGKYELWGSGVCGKFDGKGLEIEATNGTELAESDTYKQIEGVLVAAEANGGVKLIAMNVTDTPTGVESLEANGKAAIYGTEGAVVVAGADGKVAIFDAMGRMVKIVSAEGAATVEMPAGYYIVRTAGTAKAVIVK